MVSTHDDGALIIALADWDDLLEGTFGKPASAKPSLDQR